MKILFMLAAFFVATPLDEILIVALWAIRRKAVRRAS